MCPEPDLYLEQIFGFKTNSFELGLKLIVSKQYLIFSFRFLEFEMTIFSILITFLLSLLIYMILYKKVLRVFLNFNIVRFVRIS